MGNQVNNQRDRKARTENVYCANCGKMLLKRQVDGSFYFRFGKKKKLSEEELDEIYNAGGFVVQNKDRPAVELIFCGPVKMRCLSQTCDHSTIILPNKLPPEEGKEEN